MGRSRQAEDSRGVRASEAISESNGFGIELQKRFILMRRVVYFRKQKVLESQKSVGTIKLISEWRKVFNENWENERM
jgi:hypothetical protein